MAITRQKVGYAVCWLLILLVPVSCAVRGELRLRRLLREVREETIKEKAFEEGRVAGAREAIFRYRTASTENISLPVSLRRTEVENVELTYKLMKIEEPLSDMKTEPQ